MQSLLFLEKNKGGKKMKTCIFAGTFDPITVGHEYVIKKCLKKYGRVLVVVGSNPEKTAYFSVDERLELISKVFEDTPNVFVVNYLDLEDRYKDYLKEFGVKIYVRGIRNRTDLKFENAMKKKNKKLYPFIKTRYIKCPKKYKNVSSTLVKEYIKTGQDFLDFVPENIRNSILKIISKKTKKD